MTTNNAPKVGRLLLKRAVSNEGSLSLIIAGKWKGKVNVPKSATVGVLKTHIAAASNMSTGKSSLLFSRDDFFFSGPNLFPRALRHSAAPI